MHLQVAPSLLSADFLNLKDDIDLLNASADIIHLDIMDGSFVPNISFGFSVIDPLSKVAAKPLDAHLMVIEPQRWFGRLADYGISMVSFHCNAAGERTSGFIDEIQSLGMKAGIAFNPDIPLKDVLPYIGKADFFLVMSVFAGFGGQKFIPESLDRISELKAALVAAGSTALIEVDGGIGPDNVAELRKAGADIVVAGSSVFCSKTPSETIELMKIK